MAAEAERLCRHHRDKPAGWACDRCGKKLCELCVYEEPVQHTSFTGCIHCGAPVGRLKIHRSHVPFSARVLKAWAWPLSGGGIASMVAMGLIVGLMRWGFDVAFIAMKPFMFGMWAGSFWGYVMHLIRQNAKGEHSFAGPDFRDFFSDLALPALRGTLSTAFVWAPAAVYVTFFRNEHRPLFADPVLWLLAVAGVLYGPMSLLMAATGTSLWSVLNPVHVYANIVRVGRDYLKAVSWLGVVGLVAIAAYACSYLLLPRIPILGNILGEILTSYPPMVMAYILGALLYVRGDTVGYGIDSDFYETVHPELVAQGVKPGAPAKVAVGNGQPSENPTDVAEDGLGHAYTKGREVSLEPEGREAVVAALSDGKLDDAVGHYRTLSAADLKAVASEHHVAVGQKAAASGDFTLAVSALKAAAANAEDPTAPKAFVILGRIYAERLNDAATAQKLFHHVVTRYPGTPAAQFAQKALSRIPR